MTRHKAAPVAWTLGSVGLGFVVVAAVFFVMGGHRAQVLYGNEIGIAVGFCSVGALVAARRPDNAIGWIMLVAGVIHATGLAALEYLGWLGRADVATMPRGLVVYAEMSWLPGLIVLFTLVPLLFPTGRPPSRRWHVVVWMSAIGAVTSVFAVAVGTRRWTDFGVPNPLYQPALSRVIVIGGPLLVAGIVGSVVSVVVRYRRATGAPREQLRWFVWASVVATLVIAPEIAINAHNVLTVALQTIAVLSIPCAIGISILRYRLYDIDRLVSRTVSYAVITGLLVGVYVGFVALTTGLMPLSSSVGVAASTLAAAALFQPVRRRVQMGVDRRFNRERYDVTRTIEAFAVRLRDEVDPDVVTADLLTVTTRAMQPSTMSLWVAS
jgi:hypothetical protein